MLLNIALFGIQVLMGVPFMTPTSEDLIRWGANHTYLTYQQPWRLLTACFLHIGVIHLVVNMLSLRTLGEELESLIGTKRFVIGYLLTGLLGSLVSLRWHTFAVSAGASGAIFGLVGMLIGLLLTDLVTAEVRRTYLRSNLYTVGINLIISASIGADNAAHIGGLLGGVVVGLCYAGRLRAELGWPVALWRRSVWLAYGVPALLLAVVAGYVFTARSTSYQFLEALETSNTLQEEALAQYEAVPGDSTQVMLNQTQMTTGISKLRTAAAVLSKANSARMDQQQREYINTTLASIGLHQQRMRLVATYTDADSSKLQNVDLQLKRANEKLRQIELE